MPTNDLLPLIQSFEWHLHARNLSSNTIAVYTGAARQLAAWLPATKSWSDLNRREMDRYLAHLTATRTPGGASHQYRALQQFFKWLAAEEEIDNNPMIGTKPPVIPEQPVPVLGHDALAGLLKTCAGSDLVSRRDTAIIALFIDTGIRLAEMARLKTTDLDLKVREAFVLGKGRRPRAVKFGRTTAQDLDRYLRVRVKSPNADLPDLWLAEKGRGTLTRNGIYQMIARRGKQAGIKGLHPHQMRHTFAHLFLAEGGSEGDLMSLSGWKSRQMLDRYGASTRAERALAAYDKVSIRDKL